MNGKLYCRKGVGFLIGATGASLAAIAGVDLVMPISTSMSGSGTTWEPILGISSLLLVPIAMSGGYLFRLGARLVSPSAEELLESDERTLILFLRSFSDDEIALAPERDGPQELVSWITLSRHIRTTLEEALAAIFSELGPVIAVSQPGRRLPPLGAARAVLVDSEWRESVRRWLERSQLVVVLVGSTEGLLWEIRTIIETGNYEKMLLIFPPVDGPELQRRWLSIREVMQNYGITSVSPILPDTTAIVRLTANKDCQFIHAERDSARSIGNALRETLASISLT